MPMSGRPFLWTRQKAGRLSGWRICSGSTRLMDAHPILNGSLKDIDVYDCEPWRLPRRALQNKVSRQRASRATASGTVCEWADSGRFRREQLTPASPLPARPYTLGQKRPVSAALRQPGAPPARSVGRLILLISAPPDLLQTPGSMTVTASGTCAQLFHAAFSRQQFGQPFGDLPVVQSELAMPIPIEFRLE